MFFWWRRNSDAASTAPLGLLVAARLLVVLEAEGEGGLRNRHGPIAQRAPRLVASDFGSSRLSLVEPLLPLPLPPGSVGLRRRREGRVFNPCRQASSGAKVRPQLEILSKAARDVDPACTPEGLVSHSTNLLQELPALVASLAARSARLGVGQCRHRRQDLAA